MPKFLDNIEFYDDDGTLRKITDLEPAIREAQEEALEEINQAGTSWTETLGIDAFVNFRDSHNNIKNGEGEGSLQQVTFEDDAKNPKALGLGAIAFGGFRGDKPNNQPDEDDTTVTAEGIQSFAQGCGSHAFGNWSIAMGKDTKAYQKASVSFNGSCIAGNKEGDPSDYSFAFAIGEATQALGRASFSANDKTKALGLGSTSFGCNTQAQGDYTVVGGYGSIAASMGTNALGWYCKTGEVSGNQLVGQTVLGVWNAPLSETGENRALLIVGGGDSDTSRKNSMVLQKSGRLTLSFSGVGYEDQDAVIWKSVKNSLGFTSKDSNGTSTSSATNNAYNSISSSGYGLAVGYANNLGSSQHSILVGYANKMLGGYQASAAIGMNLQVASTTQVVIGQFNDKRNDGVFVVGNGTSTNDLKNIMVLTNTGVLEVARVQGVADEATHATSADNATRSTFTSHADSCSEATHATSADNADEAIMPSGYKWPTDKTIGTHSIINILNYLLKKTNTVILNDDVSTTLFNDGWYNYTTGPNAALRFYDHDGITLNDSELYYDSLTKKYAVKVDVEIDEIQLEEFKDIVGDEFEGLNGDFTISVSTGLLDPNNNLLQTLQESATINYTIDMTKNIPTVYFTPAQIKFTTTNSEVYGGTALSGLANSFSPGLNVKSYITKV